MVSRRDRNPEPVVSERQCPHCGSTNVRLVTRGYTGPTDETDQYFECNVCHQVTFELVAKNAREMRLGRWQAGGVYREPTTQSRYHISRILKVGVNEFLIYLRPVTDEGTEASSTSSGA